MAGDSPTNFKRDLIKYLSAYKLPELVPWVKKLQNVDMSAVRYLFFFCFSRFCEKETIISKIYSVLFSLFLEYFLLAPYLELIIHRLDI